MKKHFLKSKTLWFNAITIAIGIAEVLGDIDFIPAKSLILIIGIGNLLLRVITSEQLTIDKNNL